MVGLEHIKETYKYAVYFIFYLSLNFILINKAQLKKIFCLQPIAKAKHLICILHKLFPCLVCKLEITGIGFKEIDFWELIGK